MLVQISFAVSSQNADALSNEYNWNIRCSLACYVDINVNFDSSNRIYVFLQHNVSVGYDPPFSDAFAVPAIFFYPRRVLHEFGIKSNAFITWSSEGLRF